MGQFYISFIFIGIVLVAFSLILILLDKRKVFNFVRNFEEKKQELVDIINDAEQMIEELNKFSDYIVTQMDFKNEELSLNLKKADERISSFAKKAQDIYLSIDATPKELPVERKKEQTAVEESVSSHGMIVNGNAYNTLAPRLVARTDKVISINAKHNEVLRLARSGFDEINIAKKLNMGKGEIQLILEMNK